MRTKIPSQKVKWLGIYKRVYMFGSKCRLLEAVVNNNKDAEDWLSKTLLTNSWEKRDDYMIEEVEVKMKAWEIN